MLDSFEVDQFFSFESNFNDYSQSHYNEEDVNGMLIVAEPESIQTIVSHQSTFQEKPNHSIQRISKTSNNISKAYKYPRESKNYYKNIGPKLKNYISENFSGIKEVLQETQIQDFLNVKNQSHCKKHFMSLLQSELGLQICKSYFKNLRWAQHFVNDDIELYVRLNNSWDSL